MNKTIVQLSEETNFTKVCEQPQPRLKAWKRFEEFIKKAEKKKWAKEVENRGAGEILLTSMDTDGVKNGFDLQITEELSKILDIPVIASGGAGNMQHFKEAFDCGASAALAASIFHFKEVDIMDLKRYLKAKNINVRI